MRLPPNQDRKVEVNAKHPLRPVSRLHGDHGLQQQIPDADSIQQYSATLVTYLSSLNKVLAELKPIVKRIARDNTVIVMVCNHGQSELLMNFACSSHARGFNLQQVLVFATDLETKALAEGLGLTVFYDHTV
jgi:membrane-anchored protein YejM (alkaline phosphatase superfamily)